LHRDDDKGGRLPKSRAIPVTPLDPEMRVHKQSDRRGHFQSRFAALVVDDAGASATDRQRAAVWGSVLKVLRSRR
jgi:hypothetical protein